MDVCKKTVKLVNLLYISTVGLTVNHIQQVYYAGSPQKNTVQPQPFTTEL